MKKRQLKKLAKQAIKQIKTMPNCTKIEPAKIRNALFLYLLRSNKKREPKLYREFWDWFNRI